jgi:uncharacterized YkwD family protein
MPSVARSIAVVVAGALMVTTVATAERYLVVDPLGVPSEDAIKLAGEGNLASTPTLAQSGAAILKVARTGTYLGRVRGVVTLAGPDAPPDGASVTFTLYGAKQQSWTDGSAPFAVRVDTRTLPNGEYKLAVATRWPGGMSTRVARLQIANPLDQAATKPKASVTTPPPPAPKKSAAPKATPKPPKSTTTTKTSSSTTTKAAANDTPPAEYTDEVVRLTNVERAANGCGALSIDATLTKVAQAHSQDMADHDYFSHDSQDGRSPFDRMTAAGYSYSTAAENIAAGQATPADVVEGWMNSEGHRANILNCAYTEIGVGYAKGGSYGTYWTQDFGKPA